MVASHYGKGKREGITEGEAKGRMEAKWETARTMQARGMDITLIAELTGVTVEQLQTYKRSNHSDTG